MMKKRTFTKRCISFVLGLVMLMGLQLASATVANAAAHPILENLDIPEIPFEVGFVVEAAIGAMSIGSNLEGLADETIATAIPNEYDGHVWYTADVLTFLMFSNEPIRNYRIPRTPDFGWGRQYSFYTFPTGTQYIGLALDAFGTPGWSLFTGFFVQTINQAGNPDWFIDWDSIDDFADLTIPQAGIYLLPAFADHGIIYRRADIFYDEIAIGFRMEEGDGTTQQPIPNTPNLTTASKWAHDGINQAFELGLIPAALQNNYTANITRAEFASLAVTLYETLTGTEITGRMQFNDTNDVNVQKAGYIGVLTGVGNDNFAPNNTLTREQAAVMLSRLADIVGQPLPEQAPTFADNGQIASWAFDAVGQMQASGIMGGVGDNMFAPQGDYTREQSIITILRLFEELS